MIEQNAATYTKANFTAQFKSHSVRYARRREVMGHKVEKKFTGRCVPLPVM